MGTTVYPAKIALKSLLENWSWPDGAPRVMWGPPMENEDVGPDALYFGSTEITDEFRVLGATRSDETYQLQVGIEVRKWGDDEQSTEARAWQLHDELLKLLQANMTLEGAINHITGYRVRQLNPLPQPKQWRAVIIVDVSCVGYITY